MPENVARYEAIAQLLLEGMRTGRYPVGSLLPTEADLARDHSVSRQTVRAAMRKLLELGAISRRKGIGTRVEPRAVPAGGFQQALGSLEDLVRYAEATRRDIRTVGPVTMDRQHASDYGCKPGSRWLHIGFLRQPAQPKAPPLAYTDVYIDARFDGIAPQLRIHQGLYSDLINAVYGVMIEQVQQDTQAMTVHGQMAADLGMAEGGLALRVLRRYFDRKGALVEFTVSIHPSERYTLSTTLRRVRT